MERGYDTRTVIWYRENGTWVRSVMHHRLPKVRCKLHQLYPLSRLGNLLAEIFIRNRVVQNVWCF